MTLSISELTNVPSIAEARDELVELVKSDQGYPETLFTAGAPFYSLATAIAAMRVSGSNERVAIFSGSYNSLSSGEYLSLLASNRYGNTRIPEAASQGIAYTSSSLGVAAPAAQSFNPGTITFTEGTVQFFNVDAITVYSGSVASGTFECASAGTVGNIPYDTTVSSPQPLDVWIPQIGSTGTWLTRAGVDKESDKILKQRNSTKWATQGFTTPAHVKHHLIASGNNEVTKVRIDDSNPLGAYSFIAYVSNDQSAVTSGTLATLNAIVTSSVVFGSAARQQVRECPLVGLNLSGTVYVKNGYNADTVKTNLEAKMDAYLNQLPPGAEQRPPYFENQLALGDIYKVINNIDGVSRSILTNPVSTLSLNYNDVVVAGSGSYDGLNYVVLDRVVF